MNEKNYEQIYTNILCKLVEIDKFLRRYSNDRPKCKRWKPNLREDIEEFLCEDKLGDDLLYVEIKSTQYNKK